MILRLTITIILAALAGSAGYRIGSHDRQPAPATPVSPTHDQAAADFDADELARIVAPRDPSAISPQIVSLVDACLAAGAGDPIAALVALADLDVDDAYRAEAGFELISRFSATELRNLVTRIATGGEDSPGAKVLEDLFDDAFTAVAMFDRWASLDPDGVAAFALSPWTGDGDEPYSMNPIMRGLSLAFMAQRDPQRGFEIIDQIRNSGVLGDAQGGGAITGMEMFFDIGIALTDPVQALRTMRERGVSLDDIDLDPINELTGAKAAEMLPELLAFPEGAERSELLADLHGTWGSYDLGAALASASAMPEGPERDRLIRSALGGALDTDPRAAAEALMTIPAGENRAQLVDRIVTRWSRTDPVAALEWAREQFPEAPFAGWLQDSAERLPVADAVRFVEALSPEERGDFFARRPDTNHFIMRLLRDDAAGALAWLSGIGGLDADGKQGSEFAQAALEGGIDQAIAAAAALPPGELREAFTQQVAAEAAREHGADGVAWARDQGPETHRAALVAWAHEDPQAAADYASGTNEPALIRTALGNWAQDSPGNAYAWLVENQDGNPEGITGAMGDSGLLEAWTARDPASAARAMLGFPDDLAGAHLSQVIAEWAGAEPRRASQFVEEQVPAGPLRDAARAALAEP